MSMESVMPSNHLILCRPLLFLPSIFPSIRVFSNESALRIRWPEYWSFSFSISPSNEYSGLISFRTDWFDLLAVQGTLKSLCQHHSSKASVLRRLAFFMVQLSHTYMITGKTTAWTIQTFISKGMSLLFNMLSRLVIAFLPRSKCLLISWLEDYTLYLYCLTNWQTLSFAVVCLLVTDCKKVLWNITKDLRNEKSVHVPLSNFHNEDLCENFFMKLLLKQILYLFSFLKIRGKQIITSSFLFGL